MGMFTQHGRWAEARRAESRNDWLLAAEIWRELSENSHADSCELIARANDRGDQWRRRVKELMAHAHARACRQATDEIYGPSKEES